MALPIQWTKGDTYGSFGPVVDAPLGASTLIFVGINGRLAIQFADLPKRPPFSDEGLRLELLRRLNEVQGVGILSTAITRYPSIRLSALVEPTATRQFLEVLDWILEHFMAATV